MGRRDPACRRRVRRRGNPRICARRTDPIARLRGRRADNSVRNAGTKTPSRPSVVQDGGFRTTAETRSARLSGPYSSYACGSLRSRLPGLQCQGHPAKSTPGARINAFHWWKMVTMLPDCRASRSRRPQLHLPFTKLGTDLPENEFALFVIDRQTPCAASPIHAPQSFEPSPSPHPPRRGRRFHAGVPGQGPRKGRL